MLWTWIRFETAISYVCMRTGWILMSAFSSKKHASSNYVPLSFAYHAFCSNASWITENGSTLWSKITYILSVSDSLWGSTLSVEYLNLALALLVYSVRYPALFWTTNKCMGMIFSFQLLINGLHTLLAYAGMSILYKVGRLRSIPEPLFCFPVIIKKFPVLKRAIEKLCSELLFWIL